MPSLGTNMLASGQSIPAGSWLASQNNRYIMVMQTNCILAILDTSTNPNQVVWMSGNAASATPQNGVFCEMCPNDLLEILLNGAILASSTNGPRQYRNPVLCLGDDGVARICVESCTGTLLWSTYQAMPAAGATELLLMERVDGLASDVNRLVREVEALKRPPSESPGEYQMHESGIPPKEEAQPHSAKKKAG